MGDVPTAAALFAGVAVADLAVLRKARDSAWINAGREVVALLAAYGLYAATAAATPAWEPGTLSAHAVAPLTVFVFGHLVIGRALSAGRHGGTHSPRASVRRRATRTDPAVRV